MEPGKSTMPAPPSTGMGTRETTAPERTEGAEDQQGAARERRRRTGCAPGERDDAQWFCAKAEVGKPPKTGPMKVAMPSVRRPRVMVVPLQSRFADLADGEHSGAGLGHQDEHDEAESEMMAAGWNPRGAEGERRRESATGAGSEGEVPPCRTGSRRAFRSTGRTAGRRLDESAAEALDQQDHHEGRPARARKRMSPSAVLSPPQPSRPARASGSPR